MGLIFGSHPIGLFYFHCTLDFGPSFQVALEPHVGQHGEAQEDPYKLCYNIGVVSTLHLF
jgi:hypothetical protein